MGDELAFDLDALRGEAGAWDDAGDRLGTVGSVLDAVGLSPLQMGPVAFLHSAYQGLQHQATTLLGQGGTEAAQIGAVLLRAADTYERNEDAAEEALREAFQ